jgi:hypothetical protein
MGLLLCRGYNGSTVVWRLQWVYCCVEATMGLLLCSDYNGSTVV